MDVANRIKIYRKYFGLSQETLASRAGINEKYYGRIEQGKSCPTVKCLTKLCDAMEIDVAGLFLLEIESSEKKFRRNPCITNAIVEAFKQDMDIHFNRNVILDGCENSIWYNGFIGSMNFDEFELKVYAEGNIKGELFKNFEELLELNGDDVSNELKKYISDDKELQSLIEYMPFDQEVLKERQGNAFFVSESNWLTACIINNNTEEVIYSDIILESDNIMDVLKNKDILFDYVFSEKYKTTD